MYINNLKKYNKNIAKSAYAIVVNHVKGGTLENLAELLALTTSCRSLQINMNNLKELPELPKQTTRLILQTPALESLPKNISKYSLETLEIRSSSITELPEGLWEMPHLKNFTLTSSRLETLKSPSQLPTKSTLFYLRIHCPELKQLPNLSQYPLGQLGIWSKRLTNIQNCLPQSERLYDLNISAPISHPIVLAPKIRRLHLSNFTTTQITESALPTETQHLNINNCQQLKTLPEFPEVTKFNNLHISGSPALIPASIKHCTQLYNLNLSSWSGTSLPDELAFCHRLRYIYINDARLKSISPAILRCSEVNYLRIQNTPIKALPEDWSGMKRLAYLDLSNNKTPIENLDFLKQLPLLKSLNIDGNYWPPHLLITAKRIPIVGSATIPGVTLSRSLFVPFAAALGKSRLTEADKMALYERFRHFKNFENLPKQPLDWLIKGLAVNHQKFRKALDVQLLERVQKGKGKASMNKDMVLFITGNIGMKKTDIRTKLTEIGGTLVTKFSNKVTHLLIGTNPTYQAAFAKSKAVIINEHILQDYFSEKNPQFLETEESKADTQMSESVAMLLRSEDETTLLVGLEMLKNGGVPDNLLGDVLALCKSHGSEKIRKVTRELLRRYGDPAWHPLLSHRVVIRFSSSYPREYHINRRLSRMAKTVGVPATCALSDAFQAMYGRGGDYAKRIREKEKEKEKKD